MSDNWERVSSAPEDVVLMTKISDETGDRMEQRLVRKGHLWFVPDLSSYVYYRPTHWRYP